MKLFMQSASMVVAIVALGISVLTYTQLQSLRTADHSAAEAVEKLRQDIAIDLAQKLDAAEEQAQALQQGMTQDLKKFQEVTKAYNKPFYWSDSAPFPSPSPATKKEMNFITSLLPSFMSAVLKLHTLLLPVCLVLAFAGLIYKIASLWRERSITSLFPYLVKMLIAFVLLALMASWGGILTHISPYLPNHLQPTH